MSINVVLQCRDGIVLGCDSLGSMIQKCLDPKSGVPIIDKGTGQPLLHPDTKEPVIDVRTMRTTDVVVNTLGHENKLMTIPNYPIGFLTCGLGMIGDRCISDLVGEFGRTLPADLSSGTGFSVGDIVERLKTFLSSLYAEQFKSLPEIKAGPRLDILIGGFSTNEYLGEIYKFSLPSGEVIKANSKEAPYVMLSAGQSDAIERFMNGMEQRTVSNIVGTMLNKVSTSLVKMEKHTREFIISELTKNGISVPPIPPTPPLKIQEEISLKLAAYKIPLNLFSIQDAVDFVVFLIYIVYGRQRFVVGIPTVGGKVKIAYITKHEGFRDLTPQQIDVRIFSI